MGEKEKLIDQLARIAGMDRIALADFIIADRKQLLKSLKIKPHSYRIPCPDGISGCLVIHYSKDLIITPEEREFNDRIDAILKNAGVTNE